MTRYSQIVEPGFHDTKKTPMYERYKIKVLDKALQILDLFVDRGGDLTLTQIHELLHFNKVSTFRILKNLEGAGYLEKDPDSARYRLGLKAYRLGSAAEPHARLRILVRPTLEELNRRTNETVHLAVLHQGEVLYLDKIEGRQTIRVITRVGMKLPAHCSGVGKVLLSDLPEESLDAFIRQMGLPGFTPNTITAPEALKRELARVRRQGFALDNEEIEEGLKCVSAPVRDAAGRILAAISISAPKERFDRERDNYTRLVMDAAREGSLFMDRQGLGGGKGVNG